MCWLVLGLVSTRCATSSDDPARLFGLVWSEFGLVLEPPFTHLVVPPPSRVGLQLWSVRLIRAHIQLTLLLLRNSLGCAVRPLGSLDTVSLYPVTSGKTHGL